MGSIPGFVRLSDETLNRGPITVFQDKLLTRTYCDEAGDYAVSNVLSPRDLVFRPNIAYIKLYHHHHQERILKCPAFRFGLGATALRYIFYKTQVYEWIADSTPNFPAFS